MRYHAVHAMLQRDPARNYTCECGAQAMEWMCIFHNAYDLKYKVYYSTNVEEYRPACIACNRRADGNRNEVCARGHKAIEGDGINRKCAECRRARQRQRYAWSTYEN